MPTVVQCPACSRKLKVPDELLGRKVKCPGCGEAFMASAEGDGAPPPPPPSATETMAPPPPPPKGEEFSASGPPPQTEEPDRYEEQYQDEGEEGYEDDDRGERRRSKRRRRESRRGGKPHRGVMILILGIVSVVTGVLGFFPGMCCAPVALVLGGAALGCGIPAWILGQKDRSQMTLGEMDPSGQGMTTGGWICAIIGTSLGGIDMVCCLISIVWYAINMAAQGAAGAGGPSNF